MIDNEHLLPPGAERVLAQLSALANPHRLRIVATIARAPNYVSQLARDLELSRPLLHMHLQRLEAAGLITGRHEIAQDGKSQRWVETTPFAVQLTPASIAALIQAPASAPEETP